MRWAWLLVLAGCGGKADGERRFREGVTFDEVRPIFEANCSPCHFGGAVPSADLRVEHPSQFVEVPHPATGLDLVRPGSTEDSYLWHKLVDTHTELDGGSGGAMPPVGPLGDDDLETVRSWILGGALGDGEPVTELDLCEGTHPGCTSECDPGPGSVTHASWHNRLTESPEIHWDPVPGAVGYEVSIGSSPGEDDAQCWTEVSSTTHVFRAIWVLEAGQTYHANVRAILAGDERSEATASAGWTVDISPPEVPTALDDGRAPVDGLAAWDHPMSDQGAGFSHFEVAIGTSPGADDALPWTEVGASLSTSLATEVAGLPQGAWYWLAVRAVDQADNKSQPATSTGFITCADGFSFVAADDDLGTSPFCVATYEMRISGNDDGNTPYDPSFVPDSRPTGTPWSTIEKGQARVACDAMGFSYQLITNAQWQAIARSIERTDSNWSGGSVGLGEVNRGHSDESPLNSLDSDGDPCVGTGNPGCLDPGSPDWTQKRTHDLHNGSVVWDLAGNLTEQVDGSTGGPDGLWMSYDGAAFTTDPGWQDYRDAFAPLGPYTEAHGIGRMYGGTGNLTRGGAFDAASSGSGGSAGTYDTGIYQANHNSWSTGATDGFRCVFVPM